MAVEITKCYYNEKNTAKQRGGQINGLPDLGYNAGEILRLSSALANAIKQENFSE
jgi:hypothetical protein